MNGERPAGKPDGVGPADQDREVVLAVDADEDRDIFQPADVGHGLVLEKGAVPGYGDWGQPHVRRVAAPPTCDRPQVPGDVSVRSRQAAQLSQIPRDRQPRPALTICS